MRLLRLLSFFISSIAISHFLLACSAQTDVPGVTTTAASSNSTSGKDEKTVSDKSQPSNLAIQTGEGAGTTVDIPANAFAEDGTKVNAQATTTPDAFTTAVGSDSAASSAINVSATDANGNPVSETATPMTINIPINGTSLTLAEKIDTNLCVLLEHSATDRFVWRYNDFDIVERKVKFTSKKFGVFMLVYCGIDPLEGFTDARDSGITALEPETANSADGTVSATITIPSELQLTEDMYCGAITERHGDGRIGSAVALVVDQTRQTVGENILQLSASAEALTTETAYVIVTFRKNNQPCHSQIGDELEDLREADLAFFVFAVHTSDLESGLTSTIGDEVLPVGEFQGHIGVPSTSSSLSMATHSTSPLACVWAQTPDGSHIGRTVRLNADRTFGEDSSASIRGYMPVPDGDSTTATIQITVGSYCGEEPSHDIATGLPYHLYFHHVSPSTPIYITPVSMRISYTSSTNVCAKLYPGDAVDYTTNPTAPSGRDGIGELFVTLNQDYDVYIPFNSAQFANDGFTPVYDMIMHVGVSSCHGSATLPVAGPDRPLNANFTAP